MAKTNLSEWTTVTDRMVIFTENAPAHLSGRKLPIFGLPGSFPNIIMKFSAKLDLDNLVAISSDDPDYDICEFKTVTQLINDGIMEEWFPYRIFSIEDIDEKPELWKSKNRLDLDKIQKIFADNGFIVIKEAIMHNFKAWKADLKSGYRDEKNNVHLFSPCGCNPFILRATELSDTCDWQTTYEC